MSHILHLQHVPYSFSTTWKQGALIISMTNIFKLNNWKYKLHGIKKDNLGKDLKLKNMKQKR